jgi:DNA ligase-1
MLFSQLALIFDSLEKKTKRLELTADLAGLYSKCSPEEARVVTYLLQGIIAPAFEGIDLGVSVKLATRALSLVSRKSEEEINSRYRKAGDFGVVAFELCGKTQGQQGLLEKAPLTIEGVHSSFREIALSSGEGSQEKKIRLLVKLFSQAEPSEAKAIARFVSGALRLGVAEATIIDALSFSKTGDKSLSEVLARAFNLRSDLGWVAQEFAAKGIEGISGAKPVVFSPIRPALAERLSSSQEIFEKLGECAVEGKYDGLRIQAHVGFDGGKKRVELFSRKQERVTRMFPDLVKALLDEVKCKECIIEGEALAVDAKTGKFFSFQETITRKRKHGIGKKMEELPLRLFVFELLSLDGRDFTKESYSGRRKKILEITKGGKTILVSENKTAKSASEIESFFEECVSKGLEGVIAKDLKSPYVAGARKFAWIKLKKSYGVLQDSLDLVVIGFYYGKGKRTEFGFGGLLCACYCVEENSFKSIAKVGTGFSEEQMQWFSENLEKIKALKKPPGVESGLEPDAWVKPEIVVTVVADEITRSPIHATAMRGKKNDKGETVREGLALRFPRFTQLREDKGPEDATTEDEVLELYEMQK